MSNQLMIRVAPFQNNDIIVLAGDSYNQCWWIFEKKSFKDEFPLQDKLVVAVLQDPAFNDGAIFYGDGSYKLDGITSIEVLGYDEVMKE
jgi:hypothetical protein